MSEFPPISRELVLPKEETIFGFQTSKINQLFKSIDCLNEGIHSVWRKLIEINETPIVGSFTQSKTLQPRIILRKITNYLGKAPMVKSGINCLKFLEESGNKIKKGQNVTPADIKPYSYDIKTIIHQRKITDKVPVNNLGQRIAKKALEWGIVPSAVIENVLAKKMPLVLKEVGNFLQGNDQQLQAFVGMIPDGNLQVAVKDHYGKIFDKTVADYSKQGSTQPINSYISDFLNQVGKDLGVILPESIPTAKAIMFLKNLRLPDGNLVITPGIIQALGALSGREDLADKISASLEEDQNRRFISVQADNTENALVGVAKSFMELLDVNGVDVKKGFQEFKTSLDPLDK